MWAPVLFAVVLLAFDVTFSTAQRARSCKGECGAEYYRGYTCQCDYNCLSYGECCKDFESQCTTKDSCKGRCGESFRRGRLCSCDSDCDKYKQCCSDFKLHCDEEAEISGAANAAPVKTNSCDNVNDFKPKDPTEVTEPSTFNEGNNEDEYGQIFPNDDVSDLEGDPVPESTAGYESATANQLDQSSAEPTADPDPLEVSTETAPADDATTEEVPTESSDTSSSDPGPTPPQTTTVSNQPTPTSVPQTESSPTAITPEVQPEGSTVAPDEPEVATAGDDIPVDPQSTGLDSTTVQENLETSTDPVPTLQPTSTPEETSTNPRPDTDVNALDVTAETEASLADDETPTTQSQSTTETVQDTTDEVTPRGPTADPPEPTKSAPEDTTEDQDKPESDKTSPTKPTPAKPQDTTDEVTPRGPTADPPEPTKSAPEDTTEDQDKPESDKTSPTKPTPAKPQDTTDEVTPSATTADPLNVTPQSTKSAPSEETTKAQDKPDPVRPSPAKPTPAKPTPAKPSSEPLDTADKVTPGATTADPLEVTPKPTKSAPSEAQDKPDPARPSPANPTPAKPIPAKPTPAKPTPAKPTPAKPTPAKPSSKPRKPTQTLSVDDPRDFQGDDSNDTNLCSGRPIGAVTTLRNGTMVVFRGHYFWLLDSNRVPGPARGITQVWGVPSPIDTAFTRCNCQGKTYIFKGTQYWRFENDVLDPNYPKAIKTGFDGLRGQITAALSVPQYRRRRESVYFFKRGGSVQKYSYQFGTNPTCSSKVQHVVYTVRNRVARQAVSVLGPSISIRTSWRGFPSTVTAAVSVPTPREPEGYKYYVFSKTKSYSVRMESERPVIVPPPPTANASPQSNDFIKCPKKV